MNSFIETLNQWGGNFLSFAWPMLWQSSLLIVALLAFDFLFRRKVRASIRYALWLVVLVKLCVPPTLALPTSPAWWLHKTSPPVLAKTEPHYTVTYDNAPLPEIPQAPLPVFVPPKPAMMNAAWLLVFSISISSALLLWLLVRWWQITRQVRCAATSERLAALADEAQKFVGMKFKVQVKMTANSMSPAVCGLFRPAILIPQSLAENFSDEQLRAVLLHELIHLRRRDVWVNFFQALLQIFYWWHPLVWLANARIRQVREEAVDDAVMLVLRDEAETYAPTLLEVAKLALNRPLASLGLVGILESRHALRQRIERLVDFRPPRQAGLTLVSLLGILAFTAVAVPMGEGPAPAEKPSAIATTAVEEQSLTVKVNPEIFIRNVKAQAAAIMHATNDTYTDVLVDILRGEGVDCAPPHGLAFNTKTGEITTQNTPELLEIFRQAIEQLNQPDSKRALNLDSPVHRQQVLITADIYSMRAAEFEKVVERMDSANFTVGKSFVGTIAADHFAAFQEKIKSLGLKPFTRPRIQTSHGKPAQFFVGNDTNGVEFDCLPLIGDQVVELAFNASIEGDLAGDGFTLAGTSKHSVNGRVTAENHGGIVVCADNPDGSVKTKFVAVVGVQILTNGATPHFQQRLQAIIKRQDGPSAEAAASTAPNFQQRLQTIIKRAYDTNFSTSGNANNLLISRVFAVDPRTFAASLKAAGVDVGGSTNPAEQIVPALRNFFASLGVDMKSPPGKSVFYKDTTGRLFVRATKDDLDIVERAIEALNSVPPQVHIKARFIEVTRDDSNALGFDWYLGQFNGGKNVSGNGGGSLSTNVPVSAANPLGVFPGKTASSVVVPAVAKITGILSDPNFRVVLHALQQRDGVESLAEPDVTTISGRQTQMRATQIITVVTNMAFQDAFTNQDGTVVTNAIFPQTATVETGPILDVVPYVLSDGYTINLALIPSLTEFLGYDKSTNTTAAYNRAGEKIDVPKVIPKFRVRQVVATVNVLDNQTVVLGGFPEKIIVNGKESAGKPGQSDKELLVFITATIVDQAGSRVHKNDELPFAGKGVPPQPSQPK
jgi:beta-lactamase regulating signal transducer with metallopeptidase domain/Flp pilus assembly secretin CpaC